ncbi:hypothetical protein ACSW0I_003684 [Vibrio fluvialis]
MTNHNFYNNRKNNEIELAIKTLIMWGASKSQIESILDLNGKNDSIMRSNLILIIRKNIDMNFSNPENQKKFMSMKNHNPFFKGRSPLETISSGYLIDIIETESRTRFIGQW